MISALKATLGKVCLAAEQLGCLPETIYHRAQSSPRVSSLLRLYRGKLLDAAEAALWRGVLDGESWAVKWALEHWGNSRMYSDGAEIWHSPQAAHDAAPHELVRALAQEMLTYETYTAAQRARQLDCDSGDLRHHSQRGPLADDTAPGSDRSGDCRDDPGTHAADSGD
jgi:hypothetical protein